MPDNSPAQTITFSEADNPFGENNSFESYLDLYPEGMCRLGNLLISFNNGQLYTHDSNTYNQFFGVNYPSSITFVFNQNSAEGKRFLSLDERANVVWNCPDIQTSLISFGTTPQQSNLVEADFELVEGKWCAKFLQDQNSIGGLLNGNDLRGMWIKIKFQADNAQDLVILNHILLQSTDSPKNV